MLALLAYVVLLLIVMPGLLLGMGKLVATYTKRRPGFIGFPVERGKSATAELPAPGQRLPTGGRR